MKTIFKFPITGRPILMALNARFLHFDMQNGQATAWFEVRTDSTKEERSLTIFGTGHEVPDNAAHLGTCMDGQFVWHLYDLGD
jgi:hypothetical protein